MDLKFSPKISIIIPVYNIEKYLPKCLESVLNQSYKNLEIICIDDGSTDGSLNILKRYGQDDIRIKIISQKNRGLSEARNAGNREVSGKYIMYVDGDDWIDLDTCKIAVEKAEAMCADVVFWNYVKEYDNASQKQMILEEKEKVFESKSDIECLHRRFVGLYGSELSHPEKSNSIVTAWGKLYRADIILKNKILFIDTKIIGTEDALFNLYVFGHVKKAVYLPLYCSHYRKNNISSLTQSYKSELQLQWNNLYAYMQKYIDEHGCDETFRKALYNRVCLDVIGLGFNAMLGQKTVFKKVDAIKNIIRAETYREASKHLELKYFPIHWRVFIVFAKQNCAFGIYTMLGCIKIINRLLVVVKNRK